MDLQDLRAFLALADELHFGRAANRLHMAQPPLTRTIQRLERELGVQLFDRSARHVVLTTAGESLVEPAQEALESAERVRMVARAAGKGVVGRVRLSYAGASSLALVGSVAREAHAEHPGLRLDLITARDARDTLDLLDEAKLDLAIGRFGELPASIDRWVLADEPLVVAMPASHPLSGNECVELAALDGQPMVALPMGTGALPLHRLALMAQNLGISLPVVQTAPDSWTLMSLVSAEIGCSITVGSVAPMIADPHVVFVPLAGGGKHVELVIAWRRGQLSPAAAQILRMCRRTPIPGAISRAARHRPQAE